MFYLADKMQSSVSVIMDMSQAEIIYWCAFYELNNERSEQAQLEASGTKRIEVKPRYINKED